MFFQQWAATSGAHQVGRGVELTQISGVPQLPLELVLFIFVLGCAAIVFVSRRPLAEALGDMGISAAGLLVVALPLSSVVRIHAVDAIGPKLLLFTLVLVWAGDTLALLYGALVWPYAHGAAPEPQENLGGRRG